MKFFTLIEKMKKQTILICFLFGLFIQIYGQTLEENKIDEFTKHDIKRTSWETLNMTMSFTSFFRISRIDNKDYFDLKLMMGDKVFAINKDKEIMFQLENGEIVKLPNIEFAITCIGCGAKGFMGSDALGIKVIYKLDNEQFEKLKNNIVIKVRIYTNDFYIEGDVKKKNALTIQNALKLVE